MAETSIHRRDAETRRKKVKYGRRERTGVLFFLRVSASRR